VSDGLACLIASAASNAQHDQRYKSDADEQHYDRHEIVFEPMPITGRHDVHPCFKGTFFLDAKIGGHLTSIFDADQKMSLREICSAGLVLHIEKSKKAIDVAANLSDQQAPTGRIATPPSSKANFAERGIRSMPIEFQNSHGSFSPACML
jgi:hypothetical protein